MSCSIFSFIGEHPGWVTLWLVILWCIVGEFLEHKYGERF